MKQLNAEEKQAVTYCIPLWLRDEQIKLSSERIKARIAPSYQERTESIALVCYGASLNDTWEQIKDFKYVVSCSGSHKFLLEHGIVPTWHVEVDPRPHKVELIGPPHPDVEYLIASTCHPKLFDHLEGFKVTLWHVFDSKDEGILALPHGEWALTGGCGVGLRTMTIAAFMGFRDLHVFGMDGCDRDGTGKHAGPHPNEPTNNMECEYDGKVYHTTPAKLEAARGTFHELDQMPEVRVKFYGEGLTQAMARNYVYKKVDQKKPMQSILAFTKPVLITPEYAALNAQLHRQNLSYGVGGGRHAEIILKLAEGIKTRSILDYGCGKGYLAKAIPFPIWEYDPGVPGKEASPRPADLVVCTDVLEHIEPDRLTYVLRDLHRCTIQVGYFVIHTGPAGKTLPDGRNTHLIQEDQAWWEKQLSKFFQIGKIFKVGMELHIVLGRKQDPAKAKAKPKAKKKSYAK